MKVLEEGMYTTIDLDNDSKTREIKKKGAFQVS